MRSTTEQTIISVSTKMTAGGGVTAVGSGVAGKTLRITTENPEIANNAMAWADIGVICGIVIGLAGFIVQVVVAYRRDRRETIFHRQRMSIRDSGNES
ncbi:hypothetical protein PHACT_12630 [Pseudohongiella acticola]|uniref:Uncharacterized protein n=2 Tax=Pseudohongiella acticola TaxID=1524254 RepID=A0A1E8CG93_9GAMM|nr:hypothetical protein PHACT_12630 [Pseudohongiella acticola]